MEKLRVMAHKIAQHVCLVRGNDGGAQRDFRKGFHSCEIKGGHAIAHAPPLTLYEFSFNTGTIVHFACIGDNPVSCAITDRLCILENRKHVYQKRGGARRHHISAIELTSLLQTLLDFDGRLRSPAAPQ